MGRYSTNYSKDEVLDSLQTCLDKHGKITQAILSRDKEFVHTSDVYAYWSTLDEARDCLDAEVDRSTAKSNKKFDKAELIDILQRCHEKHGKVIRSVLRKDDEFPSLTPIQRVFGDLDRARREAGIDTTMDVKQEVAEQLDSISFRSEVERIRIGEGKFPDSGFIYTLELTRNDGEVFYYIGSATGGMNGLLIRLRNHISHEGHCSAPVNMGGTEHLLPHTHDERDGAYEVTGVADIRRYECDTDHETEFFAERERQRFVEVVREHDTTNVLGGK